MNSREQILSDIRILKIDNSELPTIPQFEYEADIIESFKTSIKTNKGEIISEEALMDLLESGEFVNVYSASEPYSKYSNCSLPEDPHELKNLDLAIIEGYFGVGENGAIWLDDSKLGHRVLPFITEHLVIVVDKKTIVPNMHEAYERIGQAHSGFGVFIAGPSKTADIEQSLVIGAHGAKSLRVLLI
ncbi:LUD domain-containing protein [Belliella sp. R4-6]|uniref:LUD domain-containing protein n=1 Tax=Belliella alkalica TaxID=1730871 RepID=A0ABS9VF13_9BACT|nr:LUD domain-containing protein [Belliella alkalica]MCH7414615.1 LUD domain-containing protein [Belliella alkalica]